MIMEKERIMNMQMLAQNVRRIRNAKKMSQSDLAEKAGLSVPAIKNLELAKSEPRMNTMHAIANALEVKTGILFTPVHALTVVRFRSSKRMQNRANIIAQVSRWLSDFNYLEGLLDKPTFFTFKARTKPGSKDFIVLVAEHFRKTIGLKSTEPIYNICGLLEHAGVKVLPLSVASVGFFGMSVGEEDGGPAVIVNVWERISVERRIFSAAHELGHLVLHSSAFDINKANEIEQEEKDAHCFASHFLMPNEGFMKAWQDSAGLNFVDRVMKLKCIYRVSYETVLYRLVENKIVDDDIRKNFGLFFQQRYNRKLKIHEEPYALKKFDFYEDRFKRLAREAVEKEKISLSRGAEILGVDIKELHELLRDPEVRV
jgi:Zn-dependent peptidase ImmA (M78 family)/DNA-binding XRE family transcriptional regulator